MSVSVTWKLFSDRPANKKAPRENGAYNLAPSREERGGNGAAGVLTNGQISFFRPITVAGPRPIFTAFPHFSSAPAET
jgi:hypothetical protein